MSEREFVRWMRHAGRRGLPHLRQEWYMAQIAYWIARTMGGVDDKTIDDYVFKKRTEDDEEDVDDLESAKLALGFKPHKGIGNGR